MKSKLWLISVFVLICSSGFAQAIDEFRAFYGVAYSRLVDNPHLIGGGSAEVKNFNKVGFKMVKYLDRYERVAVDVGLNFSRAEVLLTPEFVGRPVTSRTENFEMLSIPVNLSVTVFRHLFANAGPILDFQTSDNTFDPQSGFGYVVGIGGKYYFNNVLIFINPNFQRHTVVPFRAKNDPKKLTELGILVGVGLYL